MDTEESTNHSPVGTRKVVRLRKKSIVIEEEKAITPTIDETRKIQQIFDNEEELTEIHSKKGEDSETDDISYSFNAPNDDISVDSDDFEPDEYIEDDERESDASSDSDDFKDKLDEIGSWTWSLEDSFMPPEIPTFKKGFPRTTLGTETDPLKIFLHIFDENLINDLAQWTNAYANRTSNHERRKSHQILWRNTDSDEMMCFIGKKY